MLRNSLQHKSILENLMSTSSRDVELETTYVGLTKNIDTIEIQQ